MLVLCPDCPSKAACLCQRSGAPGRFLQAVCCPGFVAVVCRRAGWLHTCSCGGWGGGGWGAEPEKSQGRAEAGGPASAAEGHLPQTKVSTEFGGRDAGVGQRSGAEGDEWAVNPSSWVKKASFYS